MKKTERNIKKEIHTGTHSIPSIHISEFEHLNCVMCGKPLQKTALLKHEYVRPRNFFHNSFHNILVVVCNSTCKQKYAKKLREEL